MNNQNNQGNGIYTNWNNGQGNNNNNNINGNINNNTNANINNNINNMNINNNQGNMTTGMVNNSNMNMNNNQNNTNGNTIYTTWNENKQAGFKQEEKPYLVISDNELKNKQRKNGALRFGVYSLFLIVAGIIVYMYQLDKYEFYLNKNDVLIGSGSSYQVSLVPKYFGNFDSQKYKYEIVDKNIAEVDEYGKISAKVPGITELKVKYKNGINYKTMKVSVEDIDVEKIDLKETNEPENEIINLEVDDSTKIESVVNDREELNVDVDYRSSDEEVVEVDEYGNITTVGEGEAYIIGETPDGTIGDIKVVVEPKVVEVEKIEIQEKSILLKTGSTSKISVNVLPEDATDKTLKYSSDNGNVTVDNDGNIKGISVGQSVITITSSNGNVAYLTVIVKEESIPVSAIDLNVKNKEIKIGEEYQLEAIISPSNATLRELKWETSNSNIVSVSEGKIKGINEGNAYIIVKTTDGSIKEQCNIVVKTNKVPISNLKLQTDSISLKKDKKTNLEVIIEPSNATERNLAYSSNNDNIVVDQSGMIIAKKVGDSIVTVTSSNGKTVKCNVKVTEEVIEADSISLNKNEIKINYGESYKLLSTISPSKTTIREIVWNSQNSNVASVSNGKVIAKGEGETLITATTSNGKTATCKVVVKIPITSISISGDKSIKVGGTKQFSAGIIPNNASKSVNWISSNQNVAKVDKNGNVTGVAVGTSEISVIAIDGKFAKKTVTIEPNEIAVNSIKANPDKVSIKKGEKSSLSYVIEPSNATNKNVTWTSSNTKVATISNGVLTAIDAGTTEITIKTNNGKTAKVNVTVSKPVENILPTSISFKSSETITLDIGSTTGLSYTVSPSNANTSVTWSSNKNDVASVNNGTVKALKEGSATITVKTSNGKEAKQLIIVKQSEVKATSITLDKKSLDLKVGEKSNLLATINPTNAKTNVKWSCNNSYVVKVNSNGVIEAVGSGSAIITATTSEGLKDECKVNVTLIKKEIVLDKTNIDIKVGESTTITSNVLNGTNNSKITWTSYNDNIATVDQTGKVTGVGYGMVMITAKLDTGEYTNAKVNVSTDAPSSYRAPIDYKYYTLILDNQGGKANDSTTIYLVKDGSSHFCPLKTDCPDDWELKLPTKSYYKFKGYYTEKNGKGKKFIGDTFSKHYVYDYGDNDFLYNVKPGDTIKLYAYWEVNKLNLGPFDAFDDSYPYIKAKLNSKDKTLSIEGEHSHYIEKNKEYYYQIFNADDSSIDITDYNNPNFINIYETSNSLRVKSGAEWCTEPLGEGKCFSQSKKYKAIDFCDGKNKACKNYSTDYCDIKTDSCELKLYLNWQPYMASNKYDNQGATKPGTKIIYCKRDLKKLYNGSILCYTDKDGKNKYTDFEFPQKDGYIFKGYYTEKNGKGKKMVDEYAGRNDFNWKSDTLYAYWDLNKVFIGFSTGKDGVANLAKQHGNKVSVSYTTLITKDQKVKPYEYKYYDSYWKGYYDVIPKRVFHVINYGESLTKNGLADYNNSSYINLTSSKAFIKKGEEWNTKPDGTGKSYDQTKVYKASDFCDAKKYNCFVELYANWKLNVKKISFASPWQYAEYHMTSYGQNIKKGDITPSIIKVNVEPSGTGINPGITWKSSDTKILKIVDPGNDQNGKPIYSFYGNTKLQVTGFGKVKLTATSANGKSTSVNIEVTEKYLRFRS